MLKSNKDTICDSGAIQRNVFLNKEIKFKPWG